MTEDDDARHLRDEFDAAIGPTPPATDRMGALTSRYAAWRRRRAIAAGAGGVAAVAVMVAVGLTVAIGPGGSHGNNEVMVPPTGGPVSISPTATGSAPASPGPASTPPPSLAASANPGPPTVGPTPPPTATAQPTQQPQPAAGLQGTVVNEAGAPLANIVVTSYFGTTETDANGHFVAPTNGGHQGNCLIFSSVPLQGPQTGPPAGGDYALQEWFGSTTASCTDMVADVRVVMHPGADVFGTVHDIHGNPVAGVTVYGTFPGGYMATLCCGHSFSTVTDAQGRYRIYGFPPEHVSMAVRVPAEIAPGGGIATPTTAGSGQPVDLTDYGEGCDAVFPGPGCPNAPPPSPSG